MFAYIKFNATCERHPEKDFVDVARIKHFDIKNWDKNKYYKVKCGDGKCTGIVVFVRDTIGELQKIINTKRVVLPPRNKINTADESTTDDDNNYVTAKKKEDKSDEIHKLLQKKIGLIQHGGKEKNARVNEDDQPISIRLGRDVWLPKSVYGVAICNTRSRQMIVKNLAVAVFGIKMLQNSSINEM